MNSFLSKSIVVALAGLLFGCGGGGGGGDTPPVTGTTSFPLQTGYKNNVANGQTVNYAITGSCSGNATYNRSSAADAGTNFEGVAALKVTSTGNIIYNAPCANTISPDPGPSSTDLYYDYNYNYLGSTESSYYSYMDLPLIAVPMSVTVGQSDVLGKENIDTDNTKTLHLGYTEGSYAVTADTATTAIITETIQVYKADPASPGNYYLAATRKEKSRISTNGTLTPVSIEIQSNTAPSEVLIFTAI